MNSHSSESPATQVQGPTSRALVTADAGRPSAGGQGSRSCWKPRPRVQSQCAAHTPAAQQCQGARAHKPQRQSLQQLSELQSLLRPNTEWPLKLTHNIINERPNVPFLHYFWNDTIK